jgi:hypothetical protein
MPKAHELIVSFVFVWWNKFVTIVLCNLFNANESFMVANVQSDFLKSLF